MSINRLNNCEELKKYLLSSGEIEGATGEDFLNWREFLVLFGSWKLATQLKLPGYPLVTYCTGSAFTSIRSKLPSSVLALSKSDRTKTYVKTADCFCHSETNKPMFTIASFIFASLETFSSTKWSGCLHLLSDND